MPTAPAATAQPVVRELLLPLPASSNFERDGAALLIRDVHLLDAGTWTDEAQRTPCEYSAEIVQRYASNWADSSLWSRHAGGMPRSVVNRIGTITNQRASETGAIGDLRLHGLTSESRDTIALVEAGEVDAFSAELVGPEKWNPGRKLYEKQAITFLGGAIVARGACQTCKLRHNGAGEESADPAVACDDNPAEPPIGEPAETDMETEELVTKIEALEAAGADLTRQLEAAIAENAALKASVESSAETVRALQAEVTKIANTPAPKTAASAPRELAEPPVRVIVDRATGMVYGA